ncbi:Ger(x)C family spore germination protein [Paenibacillus motobuensis]|uniref:Ger(x)C family spore germination protein n=1 Tax=Paenibacillus TaxID=44249 RepID=UPI00203CB7C9|nr:MULTISPECIES: Ger(x)C family spore germination protein [Paenibacillus]MCM3039160.1 Ger(x)C family spore germination protein [Paenibacillus lutimineralis]MCM3646264.1 Ger(x)C family spore germination protein [Paenibacillus motobuensis]
MKKWPPRLYFTAPLLLLVLMLGGCWSSTELNNRVFPTIMTIDLLEDGHLEVSFGIPLPNRMVPSQTGGQSKGGGEPFTFISKKGKEIGQILRDLQLDTTRDIYFGQTRVIVVGSRFAEKGMDPIIDLISRQPNFHISANLFVTEDSVEDIKKSPAVGERFISTVLSKFIDEHLTLNTTVKDLLMAKKRTGDILIPRLSFKEFQNSDVVNPDKHLWARPDGAALFKNGKMIAGRHLTYDELRGALWITSQIDEAIASIKSPTDSKEVTFRISDIKTKIKPMFNNNQISFQVKSRGTAYIFSSNSNLDIKNSEMMIKLKETLNKDLARLMHQTFQTTRHVKCDAFRFSDYLDWRYPKAWRQIQHQWNDYYADQLKIEIDVDITLNHTGTFYRSTER